MRKKELLPRTVRRIRDARVVYCGVRVLLGALFVFAGLTKMQDIPAFAASIDSYGILPTALSDLTAHVLPFVEVGAGIGLIADIRGSLGVITAMNAIFLVFLARGIAVGLDIACGCFSTAPTEPSFFSGMRWAFARDVMFMGLIAYAYWWRRANGAVLRPLSALVFFRRPSTRGTS